MTYGIVAAVLVLLAGPALAQHVHQPSPPNAKVYFLKPKDGAVVPATFTVKFRLSEPRGAPAGTGKKDTGHHYHLLIDTKLAGDKAALPADDKHQHLGQTETTITLPPGKHTLQVVLGDHQHIPQNATASAVITVTVKDAVKKK